VSTPTATHVVKVQRPLNNPHDPWLVYAQGRVMALQQLPTENMRRLMGDRDRAFFEAYLADGRWVITAPVAEQGW
jgi:hypothetical protein